MLVGLMLGMILKSNMLLVFPRFPVVRCRLFVLGRFGQRIVPISGRISRQWVTVPVPLRR